MHKRKKSHGELEIELSRNENMAFKSCGAKLKQCLERNL